MGILSPFRRVLRLEPTIDELWPQYMEYLRAHGRKPRTIHHLEDRYRRRIQSRYGHLIPEEVGFRDVRLWHTEGHATPAETNLSAKALRQFFNWLKRERIYRGENPVDGIDFYAQTPRNQTLPTGKLVRLHERLDRLERDGGKDRAAAQCLRLIVYTGMRKSEARTLAWSEVYGDHLGLADSKTGAKVVWLGIQARELLKRVPRDGERVFPINDWAIRALWERIRAEIGCPWATIHDLRRTWSSRLADSGVATDDVAAVLGQTAIVQRRHYRHLSPQRMREIADLGARCMEGTT